MVLYKYDNYNKRQYIPKNRDYVSTEMYLKNRETQKYDSYIFGSSTALFVRPSIWKGYLSDSAKVFSFDASRENIVGIWSKIMYIDKHDENIKNAILIIDYNYAFCKLDQENILFTKHYKILNSSWLDFQYKNFLKVLDLHFLQSLLSYSITREFKPFMADCLIDETYYIDTVTNEFLNISIQEELKSDSLNYYSVRQHRLPERTGEFCEYIPQINAGHIKILNEIEKVFSKNNTEFRIIIAPNYQQISFNRKDLDILYSIFGHANVWNFSGINSVSEEMSNFYDGLHFKPYVGKQLMDVAYSEETN